MKRSKIIGSVIATAGISMAGLLSGAQPASALIYPPGPLHCFSSAYYAYCSVNIGLQGSQWYPNGYLQPQFNNQSSVSFPCGGENKPYFVLLALTGEPGYFRFDGTCLKADI